MLKKLVKYGNSNALVLDKAIMELLEIGEGDVVKLQVNNDTLTIKGTSNEEKTKHKKYFATSQEVVADIWQKRQPELKEAFEKHPEWKPGSDKYNKFAKEMQKIQQEYSADLQKIDYKLVSNEIAEKIKNCDEPVTREIEDKIMKEVYTKHAPIFIEYTRKMEELKAKIGMPSAVTPSLK